MLLFNDKEDFLISFDFSEYIDESVELIRLSVILEGLKEARRKDIPDINATYNIIHFTGFDLKI